MGQANESRREMGMTQLRESDAATITIADVTALLGIDERTVSRAIEAGEIPSVRVGRRVLIPRARLLAMLDAESAGSVAQVAPSWPSQLDLSLEDAVLGRQVRRLLERLVAVLGADGREAATPLRSLPDPTKSGAA